MRKARLFVVALIISQIFLSCEDDSKVAFNLKGPGLYVIGHKYIGKKYYQAYCWKDGEEVALSDGSKQISVSAITVSGDKVYIAGSKHNGDRDTPVFWKNGVMKSISRETEGSWSTDISLSGEDVYIAFNETNNAGKIVANYWKNGEIVPLSNGTNNEVVTSLFISGQDVYASGYHDQGDTLRVAKYWKNGIAVTLTNGSSDAFASSIFVDGEDVYVSGFENVTDGPTDFGEQVAKYWKNGEVVVLGYPRSRASAILVHQSDVYVVGGQYVYINETSYNEIKYWKNGNPVIMDNPNDRSGGGRIAVSQDGSKVFVVGGGGYGSIWVNGILHDYFNGSENGISVSDLCLVE